jgi:hypothetical protein
MKRDPRVLAANPRWASPKLEPEVLEREPVFDLGYGFSDHVYLVRRADLGQPVYKSACLIRRRYPLAHEGYTFEARVDAYLRHHDRLRASHRRIAYEHDDSSAGASYGEITIHQRLRLAGNRAVIGALRASPVRPSCCRTLARRDPVAATARSFGTATRQ